MTKSKKPKSPLYFRRPYAEAQAMTSSFGISGSWKTCSKMHYQYVTEDGAYFNWWPSTGRVWINGNAIAVDRLMKKFLPYVSEKYRIQSPASPRENYIHC